MHNAFNDIERPVESRREAYLEIKFRSRKLVALLDSGCEKSVIGRNLIPKDYLKPTKHKLNVANGAPLPILGETVLEFEVPGFKTRAHVVVSDAVTDLILGIEWLQENNCMWDFGRNTFSIQGRVGSLKNKKSQQRSYFVG